MQIPATDGKDIQRQLRYQYGAVHNLLVYFFWFSNARWKMCILYL